MIPAFIVVRTERHIDDAYWVCISKVDALMIAEAVSKYWMEQGELTEEDVDRKSYHPDILFSCDADDGFRVYVKEQMVREIGETEQTAV